MMGIGCTTCVVPTATFLDLVFDHPVEGDISYGDFEAGVRYIAKHDSET